MTQVQTLVVVITPLLSVAVTLLTSLFKQVHWTTRQKNLVALGLSLVAAYWAVKTHGGFGGLNTMSSVAAAAGLVFGVSQAIYQFLLSGTGLDALLAAVTVTTTPNQPVYVPVDVTTVTPPAVVNTDAVLPAASTTTTGA